MIEEAVILETCVRGDLLIIAPWGLDEEYHSAYARFHHLNDLAAEICNTTDAVLLNLAGIR